MKIGVLVTGDTSVRAAHSLAAHPTVDDVVVIGPARSRNFEVTVSSEGCDFLIGSGDAATKKARSHDVPLIWDGDQATDGVAVWGANARGLTLALASRESDLRLVAVAHPDLPGGADHQARFPDPLGILDVLDTEYGGHQVAEARAPGEFAACLAIGADRRVTIVDDSGFLDGIALAAAVDVARAGVGPVWEAALPYLEAAISMGLVMAEDN